MKKIATLLSVGLIAGAMLLPAAPAHAAFAGAAKCDVTLPTWPTTTTQAGGDCDGQVLLGAQVPPVPPQTCTPVAPCSFKATVDHYNETCGPQGTLPPLGTADGTLFVNGQSEGGYNWVRVGLTAVLVPVAPGASAGVAVFEPHLPLPTCAAPGSLTATVVGAAVAP